MDPPGTPPAWSLAAEGKDTELRSLLSTGDLGHLQPHPEHKSTALHIAASEGHVECLRLLLGAHTPSPVDTEIEDGADFDIVGTKAKGATALYLSSCYGHQACVELLLREGAEANHAKFDGSTPLHIAAYGDHESIVTGLLEAHADPTIRYQAATAEKWARDGSGSKRALARFRKRPRDVLETSTAATGAVPDDAAHGASATAVVAAAPPPAAPPPPLPPPPPPLPPTAIDGSQQLRDRVQQLEDYIRQSGGVPPPPDVAGSGDDAVEVKQEDTRLFESSFELTLRPTKEAFENAPNKMLTAIMPSCRLSITHQVEPSSKLWFEWATRQSPSLQGAYALLGHVREAEIVDRAQRIARSKLPEVIRFQSGLRGSYEYQLLPTALICIAQCAPLHTHEDTLARLPGC